MTTKTTKQTSAPVNNTIESMMAAGQEAMRSFMTSGSGGYGKAFEGYDGIAETGKDNVEAMVAASAAYTKGMETIANEMMAFTKSALEQNIANAKTVMAAKTAQEMIDLQTGFAKSSFEGFVSQSTKVGEMAAKTAQETIEPINARVTVAMSKMSKAA